MHILNQHKYLVITATKRNSPQSNKIETTAAVSTCCILPENAAHVAQYCYVHLLFKDLSTGSFLQDFKMQHTLGEEEPVNLLIMSVKKQRILHTSL